MRALIYVLICMAGMFGFWLLIKSLVTGISDDFSYGFAAGVGLFIFMFWLGERLGAFFVVEPEKGTWIPHKRETEH